MRERLRYYMDMVSRITFFGVCVACAASLGSLAFFLFFTNPDYLGISGFAVFYASLFIALWTVFFLAGSRFFARRRVSASLRRSFTRRTALCAGCALSIIGLSQLDILSWYAAGAVVGVAAFIDYRFSGR